jgi:Tfp pilus assembly protein PilO
MSAVAPARSKAWRLARATALALGTALALLWFGGALQQRSALASSLPELRARLAHGSERALQRPVYEVQLQELRGVLDETVRQLPSRLDPVRMRGDLEALAVQHGVELLRAEFGDETTREFYARQPATIEVRGPGTAVYRFLEAHASGGSVRQLQMLQLGATDAAGTTLAARFDTIDFRYREDDEPEAAQ